MDQQPPLQVEVPIRLDEANVREQVEILDVVALGPNHYRLLFSPGLVEGLARGDEFELAADDPLGYRVLRRSGLLCVWFFFGQEGQNQGCEGDRVRAEVERIGGTCDGGLRFVLVFSIPLAVGFQTIETLMESLVAQYDGSTWMFGNVYDPIDGVTPMDWWV